MSLNLIAIAGSNRPGSFNSALLELAVELADDGLDIETWRAHDSIPRVDATRGVPFPPTVEDLRERVHRADGLVLATPEFNRSIPGVLKDIVDWLSIGAEPRPLVGKPVILMSASPQRHGAISAQVELASLLSRAGSRVVTNGEIVVGSAHLVFGTPTRVEGDLEEQIRAVWKRVATLLDVKEGSIV